jgi:hypothetical protein
MQNQKTFINSQEPMIRKFVKIPILEKHVKNNNRLFYSEEMLYEEQ